jgi:hypothetical protein
MLEEAALAQTIEAELECLSRDELEGGWRGLCAMMLLRTTNLLTSKMLCNKDIIHERQQAIRWLNKDREGVISFATACDTLDMDTERMREKIVRHVGRQDVAPINKADTENRYVFGKKLCHSRQA